MTEHFFASFLLFPHNREYLRQEYRNKCDKSDKENLATRIEKNGRDSEECGNSVDYCSDLSFCESEFKEAEVEMEGLISLHRILALEDTS